MKLRELPVRARMWAEARVTRVGMVTVTEVESSDYLLLRGLESADAPERTDDMLALRGALRKAKP